MAAETGASREKRDAQRKKRVEACSSLLSRERTTGWVNFVVAQDEKWVSYDNPDYSIEWCDANCYPEPVPKRPAHGKKEMLSLCYCYYSKSSIYWEILGNGDTVTTDVFCEQLEKMEPRVPASHVQEGKVLLLMDNLRPHHAKITQLKLEQLQEELED